jgi:hypothetical protein
MSSRRPCASSTAIRSETAGICACSPLAVSADARSTSSPPDVSQGSAGGRAPERRFSASAPRT